MNIKVLCKKPYIDICYTGEWKLKIEQRIQNSLDTKFVQRYIEYYFGPFLLRYFKDEKMDASHPSTCR